MTKAGAWSVHDSTSAAMWYARAAARGHHRAQFDIGQLYEQGDGVSRNADVAAAWLHDAADGGIAAAGTRLKVLQAAPHPRPGGSLVAVTPAAPARNVTLMPSDENPTVELVWIAPPEPQPVHFQVQVRELSGPASRTVFTATLAETATVAAAASNASIAAGAPYRPIRATYWRQMYRGMMPNTARGLLVNREMCGAAGHDRNLADSSRS
jgi:hypothetical protein